MFKYFYSKKEEQNKEENKEDEEENKEEEEWVNVEYENLFNVTDDEDEEYKQQIGTKVLGNIDIKTDYFLPEKSNILNVEDFKSKKDHSDDFYVITEKMYKGQTCKTSEIIQKIYNIINKNCFLHGAFVFEDENGLLLEAFTYKCGVDRWRVSVGENITHNTFMNEKKFNQLRHNSMLDTEFLKSMKIYYPDANIWRYYQYENLIKNEGRNAETLNYLCNPKCNKDEKLEECTDDRKAPKKVMLFYPFRVTAENITKRYLYLKLESSQSISLEHALEAAEAYTTDVKDNSGYHRRRERLRGEKESYERELRIIDNEFYDALKLGSKDIENIKFYNAFVRSHNELFIPQSITNTLIKE